MSDITEAIALAMAEAKKHEQAGDLQAAHDIYSRVLVQDPGQRKAKKAGSSVEIFVKEKGLGVVADSDDVDSIAAAIEKAYRNWQESGGSYALDSSVRAEFDVRKVTTRLGGELDSLLI